MAKNQTNDSKLNDYALWFTMTAAILTAVVAGLSQLSKGFDKDNTLQNIFVALTCVGGVSMGLVRLATRKSK